MRIPYTIVVQNAFFFTSILLNEIQLLSFSISVASNPPYCAVAFIFKFKNKKKYTFVHFFLFRFLIDSGKRNFVQFIYQVRSFILNINFIYEGCFSSLLRNLYKFENTARMTQPIYLSIK